jgi:hypothetical protein
MAARKRPAAGYRAGWESTPLTAEKTGTLSLTVEQLAGISKVNSRFHNRILRIKEQYV